MDEVNSIEEAREWFAIHSEPVKCVVHEGSTKHVVASFAEAEKFFEYMLAPAKNTNEIKFYLHCLKEKPSDQSPSDWMQLEVGWTPHGLQVWCKRKVKLAKLSVCECGFPLLHENIPLGTDYDIEPVLTEIVTFICGGCKKSKQIEAVYVYARGTSEGGFLPREVFLPVEAYEQSFSHNRQ
jgi:hypothetical protein